MIRDLSRVIRRKPTLRITATPRRTQTQTRTMHLRPDHAVTDLPTLHEFIRSHPLGVLTTSLPSTNFPTLQCSHIPWVLDGVDGDGNLAKGSDSTQEITDDDSTSLGASTSKSQSKGKLGTLRGHIARANPHTKALIEAVTEAEKVGRSTGPNSAIDGNAQVQVPVSVQAQEQGKGQVLPGEALIVFTSPVEHYITPQFYSGSVGSGKVAPTWNYAAVQVYGRMVVHHKTEESETGEFLTRQLSDLARLGEVDIMGYGNESQSGKGRDKGEGDESGQGRSPWRIADAPVEYISMLKKGIVGMEVEITRVEGRFKGSQEKGVADRDGVIGGLEKMGGWKAREMAGFVRDMSKDQKR